MPPRPLRVRLLRRTSPAQGMTSPEWAGSTRVGVTGEMTRHMGGTARRLLAAFFALALLFAALPGTSWTAVPTDPDLSAGDYALVQVAHGTAGAVAAKATAAGATDVAALDKLDLVTARLSADALRSLQSDSRVSYLAADAVVGASGREGHLETGEARA